MEDGVQGIEAAFQRVKESSALAIDGDEKSKDRAFQDIFELNNEIGRLARQGPATMSKMKELQGRVNMITVGLKYSRRRDLKAGISSTARTIRKLKKELHPSP